MRPEQTPKQRAQEIVQLMKLNYKSFSYQPQVELVNTKFALELAALEQKNQKKKKVQQLCARHAQEMLIFKQHEVKQKLEINQLRLNYMATDISLRQAIAIVLTPVIIAFMTYLQQENEKNWFYTVAIIFVLVLLVMIMGIILYNVWSHSQQTFDLNEQGQVNLSA